MQYDQPVDLRLYLVTDRELLKGKDLAAVIEEAIAGGVTIVQLREKSLGSREFFDCALQVKAVTDRHRIPLIVNDRIDIALAVDAAGAHIGQQDLPASVARKLLGPEKILGVSASTPDEALAAQESGADYLGIGAVFPTATKTDAPSAPLETLRLIKRAVKIPIVAIGGINHHNARLVMSAGADGIAVVSAILGQAEVRRAARELHGLCGSTASGT